MEKRKLGLSWNEDRGGCGQKKWGSRKVIGPGNQFHEHFVSLTQASQVAESSPEVSFQSSGGVCCFSISLQRTITIFCSGISACPGVWSFAQSHTTMPQETHKPKEGTCSSSRDVMEIHILKPLFSKGERQLLHTMNWRYLSETLFCDTPITTVLSECETVRAA